MRLIEVRWTGFGELKKPSCTPELRNTTEAHIQQSKSTMLDRVEYCQRQIHQRMLFFSLFAKTNIIQIYRKYNKINEADEADKDTFMNRSSKDSKV